MTNGGIQQFGGWHATSILEDIVSNRGLLDNSFVFNTLPLKCRL
jgi:hypothetical protein